MNRVFEQVQHMSMVVLLV